MIRAGGSRGIARATASALLAAVFALNAARAAAEPIAQQGARPDARASTPTDLRSRAAASLQRDPRQLPSAAAERWLAWGPKDSVDQGLQADLVAAMRAYSAQDYAASLTFLYALLDREPDFPPALYQGALCYFRLRRYGDCAALMERFVRAAPQEIGATQLLGHCYYSLGNYAGAREHYERVLAALPSSPEALRGLGLSEMRLGNADRALELLAKVLELKPDHADAHAWRAQILFDEGESEAARVHAEKARELEPWEPKPWFLLSRIYAELDRTEDAERARERFELISRVDQQVRQQEGLLLHDPARLDTWVQLVALQRSVENRPGVRNGLARLASYAPEDPRTALFLVDGFDWLGERAKAVDAARRAESLVGSNAESWEWLADFYRRIGDQPALERAQRQGK